MTDALSQDPRSDPQHSTAGSAAVPDGGASTRPDPSTGTSALRIAIVGPTHPHNGGIAAHTTMLAHHLADAGHDVTLVSWTHLHAPGLHRGQVAAPDEGPEVPAFRRTIRVLSWARPDTWVRAGRRLRDVDTILVVHLVPAVVPAHLALLRAAGATPGAVPGTAGPRPQSVVVCHNVLPHEPHVGDTRL